MTYANGISGARHLARRADRFDFPRRWLIPARFLSPAIRFALDEELGWRGLLLRELAPLGFWRVSLLTGVVWGVWHAPLVLQGHNFPEAPYLGVVVMTAWTVAVTPVFPYLTVRARSVLAATVLHGSFNAIASLSLVYLTGAGALLVGPVGVAGIGAGLVATAACLVHDRYVAATSLTTQDSLRPWE